MNAFLKFFKPTQIGNIFRKFRPPSMYITRRTGVDVNTGKTDKSLQKIPNGRWNLEEDYDGSMSKIATKNNEFNNHDHCGGDLCKYPPKTRS